MKLCLSCYKCGSTNFKRQKQFCYNIENSSYLLSYEKEEVICAKCGMKDYVKNLVIKYE